MIPADTTPPAPAADPNPSHGICRWVIAPPLAGDALLEINGDRYRVDPSVGGAFLLEKWGLAGDAYRVTLDPPSCTCADSTYRKHECKHAKALRALLTQTVTF